MKIVTYYLDGLCRAYPLFIVVSFLSFGIIFQVKLYLFYSLSVFIELLTNMLIWKKLAKKYWNNYPFLSRVFGQGERPCEYCSCGSFRILETQSKSSLSSIDTIPISDCHSKENAMVEFGMPSGHAQIACSVATFWLLYLSNSNLLGIWNSLYLILIALGVSLSRVLINCHTPGQVIVGGGLGVLTAIFNYNLFKYHLV